MNWSRRNDKKETWIKDKRRYNEWNKKEEWVEETKNEL